MCYLWNLSELSLFILGYLQMNRWRCCYVTQHCLGSPWPPNVMSDSPEGQPDFRLQQYLVAPMPHCTCSSQICIANSPWLIIMTAATPACSPWQTMLCLWCHQTKFSIDLKQGHVEVTGPQPAQRHLSMFVWCSGPTGALSGVGQPEWEDGIRSYWLKLLIICEQVQRCCRAERGKDVCVC